MTYFTRIFTISLTSVSIFAATSSTGFADPDRYIPVLEQRAAILDCRYEMGIGGAARFGAEWPEIPPGGQTITWILPSSDLAAVQTDQINECADKRLGRAKTPRYSSSTETKKKNKYSKCPPGAPIMFGGSLYCIKGR